MIEQKRLCCNNYFQKKFDKNFKKRVFKTYIAADTFMPEIDLRQPGFTYSTFGLFTKNKERIQKFKETGDSRYIYQNELGKACFQHDIAYGDF